MWRTYDAGDYSRDGSGHLRHHDARCVTQDLRLPQSETGSQEKGHEQNMNAQHGPTK
jgi:hypothetical protein